MPYFQLANGDIIFSLLLCIMAGVVLDLFYKCRVTFLAIEWSEMNEVHKWKTNRKPMSAYRTCEISGVLMQPITRHPDYINTRVARYRLTCIAYTTV